MEKINFTHTSRKSWNLIRRLGASQLPPGQSRPAVSPNAVASHLLQVAKAPLSKPHRQSVCNEWRQYCHLKTVGLESDCPEEFTELELDAVLRTVKIGSAAGYDNILPEFLKHLGPKAKSWLDSFYMQLIREKKIPRACLQTKVIAILKPGKDLNLAASYRLISLLPVCLKLLEGLILHRIIPVLEKTITDEQAGFRQERITSDQVLALTTYIENGFQQNQKTGIVFLDLTTGYDMVWHAGLLLKLSKDLPCWVVEAIELFLHDRRFRLHMADENIS